MIIDALDTMHIIGLTSEYERATLWIADSISFDRSGLVNAFEITIRVLGGLLSAYYLSLDPLCLDKAVDLADRIMPIFEAPLVRYCTLRLRRLSGDPYCTGTRGHQNSHRWEHPRPYLH